MKIYNKIFDNFSLIFFVSIVFIIGSTVWPQITSSFWIDEAGTWWIINDTFLSTVDRAILWSATSPLYYSIVWIWSKAFGTGEISLRVPSIIFTIGTIFFVYRISLRWLDKKSSMMAVIIYLCNFSISFAFIDARPYAVGLFFLSGSWLSFLCWIERNQVFYCILFIFFTVATIWAHYMLFLGLVPLSYYSFKLGIKKVFIVSLSILLFIIPLIFQIIKVIEHREELSFAPNPTVLDVLGSIATTQFLILFLFGSLIILLRLSKRGSIKNIYLVYPPNQSILPVFLLATLPTLILYFWSTIEGYSIFVNRYMISKEIGLSIFSAWLLRGFSDKWDRLLILAPLVLTFFLINIIFINSHGSEDWRGSSEWVNSVIESNTSTTTVIASGFIESMQSKYLNDPHRKEILFAPQTRYPISSSFHHFPLKPNDEAERRLLEDVLPTAENFEQILLLAGPGSKSYKKWFQNIISNKGFTLKDEKKFGGVTIWLFRNNFK